MMSSASSLSLSSFSSSGSTLLQHHFHAPTPACLTHKLSAHEEAPQRRHEEDISPASSLTDHHTNTTPSHVNHLVQEDEEDQNHHLAFVSQAGPESHSIAHFLHDKLQQYNLRPFLYERPPIPKTNSTARKAKPKSSKISSTSKSRSGRSRSRTRSSNSSEDTASTAEKKSKSRSSSKSSKRSSSSSSKLKKKKPERTKDQEAAAPNDEETFHDESSKTTRKSVNRGRSKSRSRSESRSRSKSIKKKSTSNEENEPETPEQQQAAAIHALQVKEAIEKAPIGVFVLSPEFVAQKETLSHLLFFLRRLEEYKQNSGKRNEEDDEEEDSDEIEPKIVLVFFTLSLQDCSLDDDGFVSQFRSRLDFPEYERFWDRFEQGKAPIQRILSMLRDLTHSTISVENHQGEYQVVQDTIQRVCGLRDQFVWRPPTRTIVAPRTAALDGSTQMVVNSSMSSSASLSSPRPSSDEAEIAAGTAECTQVVETAGETTQDGPRDSQEPLTTTQNAKPDATGSGRDQNPKEADVRPRVKQIENSQSQPEVPHEKHPFKFASEGAPKLRNPTAVVSPGAESFQEEPKKKPLRRKSRRLSRTQSLEKLAPTESTTTPHPSEARKTLLDALGLDHVPPQDKEPTLHESITEPDTPISRPIRERRKSSKKEKAKQQQQTMHLAESLQKKLKRPLELSLEESIELGGDTLQRSRTQEQVNEAPPISPLEMKKIEIGMRQVEDLIRNATPERLAEVVASGGITALVNSMREFRNNKMIQATGCAALGHLATNPSHGTAIASANGIAAIVEAMNAHPWRVPVQQCACFALWKLAATSARNQKLISITGGIEAVVGAMRNHEMNVKVQQQGCIALGHLAEDDDNLLNVVVAGGIEAIIAGMQSHESQAKVQQYGVCALTTLADDDDAVQAITFAGGIEVILKAMRNHGAHAKVQRWGCCALWNLADNAESRRIIEESAGLETILEAMRKHESETDVQYEGCSLLKSLSSNPQSVEKIVLAGGIDLILGAMRRNPWDQGVQSQGCNALENIVLNNKQNMSYILQKGGLLFAQNVSQSLTEI